MEKTLQEITQNLITVTQRDYLLDSLDVLLNSLFTTHKTIYDLTSVSLSMPWSDLLIRSYHEQNLLENDKDACKTIITSVINAVKTMEVAEIRVAYNVSDADVRDIKNWLFYQLKRQILLNIIVDASIVGGIVLYRNGTFKDYSVGTYIDQYGGV